MDLHCRQRFLVRSGSEGRSGVLTYGSRCAARDASRRLVKSKCTTENVN